MKKKFSEWLSILLAKKPGRIVLFIILLFNVAFILVSAAVISAMQLSGTGEMNFLEAAYYTVTMILDAGCIDNVVGELGAGKVALCIVCLVIVIIGMITFTGAVIGYVTNYISSFIENASSGKSKLKISDHIVILNWNTRASEIVNDVLYMEGKQKIVVLVNNDRESVENEISERIADTTAREKELLKKELAALKPSKRAAYKRRHKFTPDVVTVVREGDVFSSKQLKDISLEKARTIIILGSDDNGAGCKYASAEHAEEKKRGNAQTVKTLMQVADITAAENSADDQKIIVEITDDWTSEIVDKIISWKQREGKCNIVPVRVNKVLGQILAQFSLMPELNLAYRVLFSNRGAEFFVRKLSVENEDEYNKEYLKTHPCAIPLASMNSNYFYAADTDADVDREAEVDSSFKVELNEDYWIDKKYVIVLGHNSKSRDIMEGFAGFRSEWNYKDGKDEILQLVIIDDEKSLKEADYIKNYPFVVKTVAADIYDREKICAAIEEFIGKHENDTSVLILSDDSVPEESIDAAPLTNLVYIQDIINGKLKATPDFDPRSIDVIVEIIDPKHFDVVTSYSHNNVVISNRYISKMIMQIGEKDALYDFYNDILVYDDADAGSYESKEIYAKKVSQFFKTVPPECTAAELIRAVYAASDDPALPKEKRNPALVLGYVNKRGDMTLFCGDQRNVKVRLEKDDKLIVFSNH